MAKGSELSDVLGWLQSAVKLNETAQLKTTVGFLFFCGGTTEYAFFETE